MKQLLDVQKLRLLAEPEQANPEAVLECELLIAGGGMGGCAAALAAARAGRAVVLTEETDWLGGQMTSQGVSALDEHPPIEEFGGTAAYYELRGLIRDYYRRFARISEGAAGVERLNPGDGWVSRLCFEPAAALWALDRLLAPLIESGRLTVLLRHRAVSAQVSGETVRSVLFRHLDGERRVEIRAGFVLDATELGDLLPLTGAEYRTGAESAAETGEPGALPGDARPDWVQSFTYPFALERRPTPGVPVPRPPGYEENRERQPYTLRHFYHDGRGWLAYRMFERGEQGMLPFWTYRRLVAGHLFEDPTHARDVAMINWPGNDFRHGNLIDVPPREALRALRSARDLSLGFCHWIQTECPRDEGGTGYPELVLKPDVMGTEDGLSRYPYIRESRRIRALRTIVEQDVSARFQSGSRARPFPDSLGIGLYPIDIHPAEGEEKLPPAAARPFQIPLAALVPMHLRNLLPACKNLGTTHITNGAYRLHPIEWNIGEAAAKTALFCMDERLAPQELASDPSRIRRLQAGAVRSGIPLYWYTDLPLRHADFEAAQLLAAWGVWAGDPEHLEFRPDEPWGPPDREALSAAPRWARSAVEPILAFPQSASIPRREVAREIYAPLRAEAERPGMGNEP